MEQFHHFQIKAIGDERQDFYVDTEGNYDSIPSEAIASLLDKPIIIRCQIRKVTSIYQPENITSIDYFGLVDTSANKD